MTSQTFEETQKQFTELPQKLYYTWLSNFPSIINAFNIPENLDKLLELQYELAKNYIAAEEIALNLVLTTQKQWWDSYFDVLKKLSEPKPQPKVD
ncbi:hypothetical protein [Gloeothece verrucosa]|uniref:Thylakoid-associated protein n=1 Tax=Gloeothece verrucosa (strain PCC 7822) TaxID=497965 RepID=E0UJ12_GLOV7|nr:hypothetical protein [Gloeothece verrucosa]ADN14592.1 conserved hypothetical protein [Gloeothece verrucosa PCC 7822]